MAIEYLGNKALLDVPKTAFLASNNYGSKDVLRCYDWATEMRDRGECVVSGFSSPLEQDILPFLLKGTQPIIIVLARRMYQQCPPKWQAALDADRLLIVSVSQSPRQSKATALARNRYILELCDKAVLVGINKTSSLYELKQTFASKCIDIDKG